MTQPKQAKCMAQRGGKFFNLKYTVFTEFELQAIAITEQLLQKIGQIKLEII